MKQVLFIDSVHETLEQQLTAKGIKCINGTKWTKEQCMNKLPETDGIIIRSRFPMDKDFLKSGKNLKFIARSGAGMENIDLNYTDSVNIKCFNAPEGNRNAVGEHALSMLLALFNNLLKGDAEVRKKIWNREKNRGVELGGKTIGIIGYGNNGSAFAKKLSGFDVNVLAYDKYKKNYGDKYAKESSMEKIFEQADVFSFHIPQTKETIYFADDIFFNSFKKPVYLINLARGKIVQTSSLLKALDAGKVLGACLDVLEFESTSFENTFTDLDAHDFEKLLASEKVIFSPHVGGWTKESYFKLSDVLAKKIIDFYKL